MVELLVAGELRHFLGDVDAGYRPIELVLLAHAGGEGDALAFDTLGDGARLNVHHLLVLRLADGVGLGAAQVGFDGGGGQPAGQEEVPGEAVLDLLHLAHLGGTLNVL